MALTYTSVELYTIDDSGLQIRPTKTYLPTPADPQTTMSIGEKIRLSITINKSAPGVRVGDIFVFNARLFGTTSNNPTPILTGAGWKIEIGGGLVPSVTLVTQLATAANNDPQQNYTIQNVIVAGQDLSFDFEFYVTTDIAEWIGAVSSANESRWLKDTPLNGNNLILNASNSYSSLASFLEISFYESDSNLQPLTFQDPIARDTNAPQLDTFSIPVATKWYDERVGGNSNWVGATAAKDDNYLQLLTISGGNVTNATSQTHKANPPIMGLENTNCQVWVDSKGVAAGRLK